MLQLDIPQILRSLARRRPIFHSEADFRLELALYLRETYPHLYPVCEYPLHRTSRESYDIMLLQGREEVMVLELKYLCQALKCNFADEQFKLTGGWPADGGCHATLKDVERLEVFLEEIQKRENRTARAAVIALTNDPVLWEGPISENTTYKEFTIKDGRSDVTGTLKWAEKTSQKTKRDYKRIRLFGNYTMHWQDYSCIKAQKYGRFRFLHIPVQPPNKDNAP